MQIWVCLAGGKPTLHHQQQCAGLWVRSVTANPVRQVCSCLSDLFHLAVFSLHFCLRGYCGSKQWEPNCPSSLKLGPVPPSAHAQADWLGGGKERFHSSGMWISTVQCNQPSVFHQHEIKMRLGRHNHIWCKGCLWLCNGQMFISTFAAEEEAV